MIDVILRKNGSRIYSLISEELRSFQLSSCSTNQWRFLLVGDLARVVKGNAEWDLPFIEAAFIYFGTILLGPIEFMVEA